MKGTYIIVSGGKPPLHRSTTYRARGHCCGIKMLMEKMPFLPGKKYFAVKTKTLCYVFCLVV